jgi:putative membrane protein
MKKLRLIPIIAAAVIFAACNGSSTETTHTDSTATMTDSASMHNSMTASSDTANHTAMNAMNDETNEFVRKAATGGLMEVELGNLAMKNGSSKLVKDFGKMMVEDHSKANDKLKEVAASKNVSLPTSVDADQQKEIDKLKGKTGTDFDKDYVSLMVDDHKDDIDEFKKAADKLTDTDFKNFASSTLPTLEKHLNAIEAIKKKM